MQHPCSSTSSLYKQALHPISPAATTACAVTSAQFALSSAFATTMRKLCLAVFQGNRAVVDLLSEKIWAFIDDEQEIMLFIKERKNKALSRDDLLVDEKSLALLFVLTNSFFWILQQLHSSGSTPDGQGAPSGLSSYTAIKPKGTGAFKSTFPNQPQAISFQIYNGKWHSVLIEWPAVTRVPLSKGSIR
jgi:hypothetical protein